MTFNNSNSALTGLKVLVVDDNTDTCELITFVLELQTVKVTAVNSASEAIAAFLNLQPDMVISDIAMPNEDGYSLIRKIRALDVEQGGQVPAIALSAYAETAAQQQALEAGFQSYIPKPVEPEKLVVAMTELMAGVGSRG